jgi:phosphoglycerate dehydrogenase-like enzyme
MDKNLINHSDVRIFASGRITPRWVKSFEEKFDFEYYDWVNQPQLPPEQLVARLKSSQVFITEEDKLSRDMIEQLPDLSLIIDCRGNPVNIDLEAANEKGIVVMNTPGRNAEGVAEITVAMMLMVARKIWPAMVALHNNEWVEKGIYHNYLTYQGIEIVNQTLGLVGLGAVGRMVAERIAGFHMNILGYDPYVTQDQVQSLGIKMVSLDELLSTSDFVSLHAPVTKSTTGMMGEREFALMKPTAFLINNARAALVQEKAMVQALTSGQIGGAALDVFHKEPVPADYPILSLPNVVALPHLGGATQEVTDHQSQIAFESLLSFCAGMPVNVVNKQAIPTAMNRLNIKI